jgi:putative ABC transport system substrate-binding protein
MNRSIFVFVCLLPAVFLPAVLTGAQQSARVPRIGYLTAARLTAIANRTEAFRQGLRDLGYVERKNIVIEWRSPEGKPDRMPALAAELVRLKVDVIVSAGGGATRLAKEATSTIPIVMTQDRDPVGNRFVASLARPGGNITGLSTLSPEISGKQLELLKEIVPRLTRVALLGNSNSVGYALLINEMETAAKALRIQLPVFEVRDSKDIETAFQVASKGRADAVFVQGGPVFNSQRQQIAALAIKSQLPAIYDQPAYVEAGGLASYGVNFIDLDRRAATYVDKILKGAKPAELPVEQPKKFEFVVNLKTAKQIGLTIPPNVLARADRVIR